MKKKTLLTTVLAGALAFGCFAAVGCGGKDNKANTEKNDGVFALNSQEEVYAYSAASAASLVGNLGVSQTNGGTSYLSDVTINDQSKYIDIINDYISLATNMLDTNGGFTITEKVSDNGDFEYKMEIQCNGVFGESSEYTMYYNKTISSVEQEDGETEIEFNIDGMIVTGNGTFTVKGTHEVEGNENEMKILVKVNESNYIEVKQEHEEGEISYSYAVFINNQKIEETSFSHEYEDGEYEVEIEIMKNGQTQEFKLSQKEENGVTYIDGKVKIGFVYLDFTIKVGVNENGEKVYEYQFNGMNYIKDWKYLPEAA